MPVGPGPLQATTIKEMHTAVASIGTASVSLLTVGASEAVKINSAYFANLSTTTDAALTVKVYSALTAADVNLLTGGTVPAACALSVVTNDDPIFMPNQGDILKASVGNASFPVSAIISYEVLT